MNILLLEDNGGVFIYLIEQLEEEEHSVFWAQNIPKAKSYWSHENIDCIIADLNMPPDGLTDEQRGETHGGLLSGWVWLKHYVFKTQPTMRKQTVIVTGYLDEYESIVPARERVGINVVAKRRLGEPNTNTVLEYVREIEKELVHRAGTGREDQ